MSCQHPADQLWCWTVNDPKQDADGNVVHKNGEVVYQTLLIQGCKACHEILPYKVIREWQVDFEKYREETV